MRVINLYGGPGSGKSTIAAGLYYKMKLHHLKVELVTEYAKDLVYAGHLETMLDQQEAIFAEQNRRQHVLRGKVDWAITDSPLGLSLVYPRMNQQQKGVREWDALEQFETFVFKTIDGYNNINIFLERPESFQEYGREHTLRQSVEIDGEIRSMLKCMNEGFSVFQTDPHVIDQLLEHIVGIKSSWWRHLLGK